MANAARLTIDGKRVAVILAALLLSCVPAAGAFASEGTALLDTNGYWRTHYTLRMPVYGKGTAAKPVEESRLTAGSPLPPAGWMAPDFDDGGWRHCRGPLEGSRSMYPTVSLLTARGKFTVENPGQRRSRVAGQRGKPAHQERRDRLLFNQAPELDETAPTPPREEGDRLFGRVAFSQRLSWNQDQPVVGVDRGRPAVDDPPGAGWRDRVFLQEKGEGFVQVGRTRCSGHRGRHRYPFRRQIISPG